MPGRPHVSQNSDFEVNPSAHWQPVKSIHEVLIAFAPAVANRQTATTIATTIMSPSGLAAHQAVPQKLHAYLYLSRR